MIYTSTGGRSATPADDTARDFVAAGIASIELSGGKYRAELEASLRQFKAAYPDVHLQVHNYFPPPETPFVLNLASLDADVVNASREHVKRAVRLGSDLGMPRYSFHAGFLLDPQVTELGRRIARRDLYPRAQALTCFIDRVGELAHWAGAEGARLLIENKDRKSVV